jgi:hypothetical protein
MLDNIKNLLLNTIIWINYYLTKMVKFNIVKLDK